MDDQHVLHLKVLAGKWGYFLYKLDHHYSVEENLEKSDVKITKTAESVERCTIHLHCKL